MADQVQTGRGTCPTHGVVDAIRQVPAMGFPFFYFGIRRLLARRRPFRCPTCGAPVTDV